MNINSINRFNNYANRPAFGRGRGDDDTYFRKYTDYNLGDGAVLRVPAEKHLVLGHGGLSGTQMTAREVEISLRDSGDIRPGASRAEVESAVRERINRWK